MTAAEDLSAAASASVDALAAHVRALPAAAYLEPCMILSGSSVGMHVRHCLDHFQVLLRGLHVGRFDYDDRGRAVDVECDRACAVTLARSIAAELRAALRDADLRRPVEVRTASSSDGDVAWQPSSLGRELQFLISHTVHHAAMIAASCRRRDLPTAGELGVAPSTLRYSAGSE